MSVHLRTKWLWVRIPFLSLKLQIWCLLGARSSLTFRQTIRCGFTLKLVCGMILTHNQMHHTDKYSQQSSIIWPVWLNGWVFIYKLSGCGLESNYCQLNFIYGTCFEQGVPWHSGKIYCGFTLKLERDMIIACNQMHHTDKYSQHSSIIWPVWLNSWVFIYELSGCGFKSCCCHLNYF